jgi:hypothetical protein
MNKQRDNQQQEPIMQNLKTNKTTFTLSAMLLSVAMLAAGCHKTDENANAGMGPAQSAGKAVDDAGANAAAATREGAAKTEAAVDQAGDKAHDAAQRAGENMSDAAHQTAAAAKEAGADAKVEAKQAGQNLKEGAANATDAAGRGLEKAGQKMQDASK